MNTKIIMTSSAISLGAVGIFLTFMPDFILGYINMPINQLSLFLIQMLGALYFAFAMLNWMTRKSLIGGIYNRPIAMANFSHFLIAGIALLKGLIANPNSQKLVWIIGLYYILFAVSFAILLFRHPIADEKEEV